MRPRPSRERLLGWKSAAAFLLIRHLFGMFAHPQDLALTRADSILILKKDHLLEVISGGKVIRAYKAALGSVGLAPKDRDGDVRTPEGHYRIDIRSAATRNHNSFHISYPGHEC